MNDTKNMKNNNIEEVYDLHLVTWNDLFNFNKEEGERFFDRLRFHPAIKTLGLTEFNNMDGIGEINPATETIHKLLNSDSVNTESESLRVDMDRLYSDHGVRLNVVLNPEDRTGIFTMEVVNFLDHLGGRSRNVVVMAEEEKELTLNPNFSVIKDITSVAGELISHIEKMFPKNVNEYFVENQHLLEKIDLSDDEYKDIRDTVKDIHKSVKKYKLSETIENYHELSETGNLQNILYQSIYKEELVNRHKTIVLDKIMGSNLLNYFNKDIEDLSNSFLNYHDFNSTNQKQIQSIIDKYEVEVNNSTTESTLERAVDFTNVALAFIAETSQAEHTGKISISYTDNQQQINLIYEDGSGNQKYIKEFPFDKYDDNLKHIITANDEQTLNRAILNNKVNIDLKQFVDNVLFYELNKLNFNLFENKEDYINQELLDSFSSNNKDYGLLSGYEKLEVYALDNFVHNTLTTHLKDNWNDTMFLLESNFSSDEVNKICTNATQYAHEQGVSSNKIDFQTSEVRQYISEKVASDLMSDISISYRAIGLSIDEEEFELDIHNEPNLCKDLIAKMVSHKVNELIEEKNEISLKQSPKPY